MPATKAQNEWIKKNTRLVAIKLSRLSDTDIIDRLESQDSMQGYIKRLIREDIAKDGWRDWVANGKHE